MCVSAAADLVEFHIGYLHRTAHRSSDLLVDMPAADNGLAGARLGIEDNNTTGNFLNQHFDLQELRLSGKDDPGAAAADLAQRRVSFLLVDLPADALLEAADAGRERGLVLFNVGATDERLREQDCRADVIHVAPTRSMLADGLAQYLVWKQWRRWLLAVGC